jgi:hypothetical protein
MKVTIPLDCTGAIAATQPGMVVELPADDGGREAWVVAAHPVCVVMVRNLETGAMTCIGPEDDARLVENWHDSVDGDRAHIDISAAVGTEAFFEES